MFVFSLLFILCLMGAPFEFQANASLDKREEPLILEGSLPSRLLHNLELYSDMPDFGDESPTEYSLMPSPRDYLSGEEGDLFEREEGELSESGDRVEYGSLPPPLPPRSGKLETIKEEKNSDFKVTYSGVPKVVVQAPDEKEKRLTFSKLKKKFRGNKRKTLKIENKSKRIIKYRFVPIFKGQIFS
ncbi:MAG: hypothetical protein GY915_00310 [bacterium]|nr:hypothetical protein [bacterium]